MTTNTTTDANSTSPGSQSTPKRVYDVPSDAPRHECPYCEAVLPEQELLDLHLGVEHENEASDAELEAFEETFEQESNQVFIYHLKVISLVVTIYFIFLFTYSAVV